MINNTRVARALIDRGIPTFPVDAHRKAPLTDHGFHDRSTDPKLVELWIDQFTGCMWGLVPADIDAIAFDDDKPATAAIMDRLGLATLRTYRTNSPNGRHVFCRKAKDLTGGFNVSLTDVAAPIPEGSKATDKLVARIDLGYVVAPCCTTGAGLLYQPVGTFADMAPLPDAVALFFAHYRDKRPPEPSALPATTRVLVDPADSVIAQFNKAFSISAILQRNGYKAVGARWLAPDSSSGMPGVKLLDGRAISHHGSDPLSDHHTHDAFSIYTVLEHRGDVRAAVRAAAGSLGIAHPKAEAVLSKDTDSSGPVLVWTPRRRDPFARCRVPEVASL